MNVQKVVGGEVSRFVRVLKMLVVVEGGVVGGASGSAILV